MLQTNLKHIETATELHNLVRDEEKVVVCCGRMRPMCIPVYDVFEVFEEKYPDIRFRDMEFDIPDAAAIINLPECSGFMGLPFTVYCRNGRVVKATSGIQTPRDIRDAMTQAFL